MRGQLVTRDMSGYSGWVPQARCQVSRKPGEMEIAFGLERRQFLFVERQTRL